MENSKNKYKYIITIILIIFMILFVINLFNMEKPVNIRVETDNNILSYSDYELLKEKCDKYATENTLSKNTINNLSLSISEETFIDNDNSNKIEVSANELYKADTVYINNSLLVTYANSNGYIGTVISKMNKDKSIQTEFIDKCNWLDATNEQLSLSDELIGIIKGNIKIDNLKYFTEDAYYTIIKSIKNENYDITAEYLYMGKQSLKVGYHDRALLRLLIKEDNNEYKVDIIIKINNKNKIFDIDII